MEFSFYQRFGSSFKKQIEYLWKKRNVRRVKTVCKKCLECVKTKKKKKHEGINCEAQLGWPSIKVNPS